MCSSAEVHKKRVSRPLDASVGVVTCVSMRQKQHDRCMHCSFPIVMTCPSGTGTIRAASSLRQSASPAQSQVWHSRASH